MLARAFRGVPRVDIAIDCALRGEMGTAQVDDERRPTAFRIAFPPFYYYAGDPVGAGGREMVRRQGANSLLMPSAPGWAEAFHDVHGGRLVALERHSFSADGLDRRRLARLRDRSPHRRALKALDHRLASALAADEDGVLSLSAFASLDQFLENGVGYCLQEEGAVTGVAFSSLAHAEAIEVSIFVEPAKREQGRATILGAALLDAALARGKVPHWDAANAESVGLARMLGYRPTGSYEAHWLVI